VKITKRQLRRIIKEEKVKLSEISAEQAANINREQYKLAGDNQKHRLGAAIEEAIHIAEETRNVEVLALLEEAHAIFMGF